jgi:hypothetical protein
LLRTFSIACSPYALKDSHRPAGAHAVAVQEQHDLADLLRLLPCVSNPLPALGADPVYRLQFGRATFDDGENVGSEVPHQLLRKDRADSLHEAAAEVPLDPLGCGRRHGLQSGGFELQPMFLVSDPPAFRRQPFSRRH